MWYFVSLFQSNGIGRRFGVHVHLLPQNSVNVNCTEECCRLRGQQEEEQELTRGYTTLLYMCIIYNARLLQVG